LTKKDVEMPKEEKKVRKELVRKHEILSELNNDIERSCTWICLGEGK